jgi:hypothetical protein
MLLSGSDLLLPVKPGNKSPCNILNSEKRRTKSKRGPTLFPAIYKYSGAKGLESDRISHFLAELFPQKGEQFIKQFIIVHLASDRSQHENQ